MSNEDLDIWKTSGIVSIDDGYMGSLYTKNGSRIDLEITMANLDTGDLEVLTRDYKGEFILNESHDEVLISKVKIPTPITFKGTRTRRE